MVLCLRYGIETQPSWLGHGGTLSRGAGPHGPVGRRSLHWTLLDDFEWNAGDAKTFGLIAVDRETFVRSVKPSARWLGQVARRNGID